MKALSVVIKSLILNVDVGDRNIVENLWLKKKKSNPENGNISILALRFYHNEDVEILKNCGIE